MSSSLTEIKVFAILGSECFIHRYFPLAIDQRSSNMAKKNKKTKTDDSSSDMGKSPLLDVARRVLLASIGASALAKDEIELFINKLVERGEIAEKDGKNLIKEILEKRKEKLGKAEDEITNLVNRILQNMNMPTKKDFDELVNKLNSLTQQIEEIKSSKNKTE
jgi:poly(hydroxyalkanoate) granule-associated protein